MASEVRLSLAVIYVSDLNASASFYTEVLGLEVTDRSPTAALLASAGNSPLVLRSMGKNATRAPGSLGVQYTVWAVADESELDRVEQALKARAAYLETRRAEGYTVVEGRDPDSGPVLVACPAPSQLPLRKLPSRIYAW